MEYVGPYVCLHLYQTKQSHQPKKCHEDTVKRIVRYLKGTHKKGLIFEPTSELTLEAFVDADFAGLWGVEEPQGATCVKLRTGYVIIIIISKALTTRTI